MPYYRRVGDVPRKRHTLHPSTAPRLAEELMGEEGFPARRRCSTTATRRPRSSRIEHGRRDAAGVRRPTSRCTPHHLRTPKLAGGPGDPVHGRDRAARQRRRRAVVRHRHARPARCTATRSVTSSSTCSPATPCSRACSARCRCGPATTSWSRRRRRTGGWSATSRSQLLVLESRSHVHIPRKLPHADRPVRSRARRSRERDLRGPEPEPLLVEGDRRRGARAHPRRTTAGTSTATTRSTSSAGTAACTRARSSIHDFEPIVGRLHQPPPVHQTFAGDGFVVCSFVPRPFDFHPDAVKVPYHHANVDSDEVLFYSRRRLHEPRRLGHRRRVDQLHPAGFVHGPQPGSVERSDGVDRTDEIAVMLDTFAPLGITDAAARRQRPGLSLVVGGWYPSARRVSRRAHPASDGRRRGRRRFSTSVPAREAAAVLIRRARDARVRPARQACGASGRMGVVQRQGERSSSDARPGVLTVSPLDSSTCRRPTTSVRRWSTPSPLRSASSLGSGTSFAGDRRSSRTP